MRGLRVMPILVGVVLVAGLLLFGGCDPSALFHSQQQAPPVIINNPPSADSGATVLLAVVVVLVLMTLMAGVVAAIMWGVRQLRAAHANEMTLKILQAHPESAEGLTFVAGVPVLPVRRDASVPDHLMARRELGQ